MYRPSLAVRAAVLGAVVVPALLAGTGARADIAPSSTDVVGVGSDVVQYALDFGADGDTKGDTGYNAVGNLNRLVNFDATADANGRSGYVQSSTSPLNPTIVLREGMNPVQRPNGGSSGLTALINDGGPNGGKISYARSPNLPTAQQQQTAQTQLGSQLHVVQIADDSQVIAVAPTTNAPAGLSVNELLSIYTGSVTTWGQLAGYTGPSPSATIIPLIPQVGAGVRTTFLKALATANGGATPTLSLSVRNVEQNDPSAISSLSSTDQANAILPFPTSRLALYNEKYFLNPATAYNANSPAAPVAAGIKLLTGTPPDNATNFSAALPYYIIFRESDLSSTTPWQPGSTLNWVQALFCNPGGPLPFFASSVGQSLIDAAGATADYKDLNDASSG